MARTVELDGIEKQKRGLSVVTKKIFIVFGLTLALMIPLSQVEDQAYARRGYETVAQSEVAKGWGQEIGFDTPSMPVGDETIIPLRSETNFEVEGQEKKRGVFRVPVYVAHIKTKLYFEDLPPKKTEAAKAPKAPPVSYILIPIQPTNSIQSFSVKDTKSGEEFKAHLVDGGIRVLADEQATKNLFNREIEVQVTARGTGLLKYRSRSVQDKVQIKGNWPKPKFLEEVLPTNSKVTEKGFEASWVLNTLPKWTQGPTEFKTIGLHQLWIGTDYSMLERSVKYGILFIAMTFILVFIIEFMSKTAIHPIQYVLIGLSISMFYLLLIAISESTGFNAAYLISSLSVTALIGFYVLGFVKQKKFVGMIIAEQVVLSAFFYVLLSLEEKAFLIGTLGLFAALALFMAITRKFDWYNTKPT